MRVRPRFRYIAMLVKGAEGMGAEEFDRGLREALSVRLGNLIGPAKPRTLLHGRLTIVRTNAKLASKIRSILPEIRRIGDTAVSIRTLLTSGTLRTLRSKLGLSVSRKARF